MQSKNFVVFFVFLVLFTGVVFGGENAEPGTETTNPDDMYTKLIEFWVNSYDVPIPQPASTLTKELLAKASPDECYFGIGDERNDFSPGLDPDSCRAQGGVPKVNQAYVWGLAKAGTDLWFGTAPNVNCLVLGALGSFDELIPYENEYQVCEFGSGPYSPLVPDAIGDWRPTQMFVYSLQEKTLTEKTPAQDPLVFQTSGIRSAGTLEDVVFLAGPNLSQEGGINLFAYHTGTHEYLGSTTLADYDNIRKWLVVDGVLYTAVGKGGEGAVLRWMGDAQNPFLFEEIGQIDGAGAELTLHEGRIFVSTWGLTSGIWMSPEIPKSGLTSADSTSWKKVWHMFDYEPDTVVAATTGGGAIASFDGYLYWGTMSVPGLSPLGYAILYGVPEDTLELLTVLLGTYRAINIFRGKGFGTDEQEVDVVYGMSEMPAYDPEEGWAIVPNKMGKEPLYGLAGFGNFFNNYTWTMAVYEDQLFVGTMDWSFLIDEELLGFLGDLPEDLPEDIPIEIPESGFGADLFRFASSMSPAFPEFVDGVENYSNYGIRTMLADDALYIGSANPMNLMTDLTDDRPEGGWELMRLTKEPGCWGGDRGDVNSDGAFNVLDVVLAVRHILGIGLLVDDGLCLADCNDDGAIDAYDVLGIVDAILGTGECAPGACTAKLTPEALELLKSLDSYLSAEDYDRFMAMMKEVLTPTEYRLAQNYPNPFNPVTTIEYSLPKTSKVRLEVYNVLGQVVKVLTANEQEPGSYTVRWDGVNASSGVYFYRLTANEHSITRRMVLMK